MTVEVQEPTRAPRVVAVGRQPGPAPLPNREIAPAHRWRGVLFAGGTYLALSLFVWLHVWTGHPSSTTTCGCGDSAGAMWDVEWPAYAMTHGFSLFYSSFMNHPTGINLMANPNQLTLSLPLFPVTWIFGPVASLNVALTLAPVLSALAMYILLRRWVSWAPAAFRGRPLLWILSIHPRQPYPGVVRSRNGVHTSVDPALPG